MRWALGVGGLLAVMAVVRSLGTDGPLEGRATLALGFLLLAAQLGTEVAGRARLPRLTAALLAGIVLGPPWLALVRIDEVRALTFLSDAALALLALSAGTLLSLGELRNERALVRLGAATILAPFVAVAAVAWSVSPWLPLTRHQSPGDGLAFALVLGSVAVASAPTVVGAVLDELGRRDRTARHVVALSTSHTLAALILFALVLVVARPIAGRGAVDAAIATETLIRLGGSVTLGGALGLVVVRAAGLRLWLSLVLALVSAEAGRVLGLEPALMALAAGCALGTAAPANGRVWSEALAPAVGVAGLGYFALLGARLDITALGELWPWVVLFAALRVVGLRAGGRLAASRAAVPAGLARLGWLGVITQGAVALGLAEGARRAFPQWGVSFEALIVALVAVNLIAGPIVLRRVLAGAGTTTEEKDGVEYRVAGGVAVAAGPRGSV